MLRPLVLVAALVAAVPAVAVPALAAEPSFPPGSRVGLVPPADMMPMKGLAGFRNLRTGAAILTIEMPPDAYPSLAAGFTDEALKSQGFTVTSRSSPKVGETSAIMVTGTQQEGERAITKSVLLAADPSMTALVIGQLPQGAPKEEVQGVEEALKSVAFRPPLTIDQQLVALPFKIGDMAGFRPIRAMAGNSLLLTDGPDDVIKSVSQPVLIVAQSFGPASGGLEGREAFARAALSANSFIKDTTIERSQSYRQNGENWHEIVAKATDTNSGVPVVVQQTILFEADGYLRAVGITRPETRDAVLPRFRRFVDSITPREP